MAIYYWFLRSFTEYACKEAYHITLVSDTYCHLWLRWSLNPPQTHPRARVFRGLPVLGDVYYCFTAYHDIEQEEAGDTLTHTFTIAPWLYSPYETAGTFQPDDNIPPYWEPWGATLTENHPWSQAFPTEPVSYSLADGILHLYDPPIPKSGIWNIIDHDTYPLVNSLGHPLSFSAKSLSATITNPTDWVAYHLLLTKGPEQLHLEFSVARGNAWGAWPRPDWVIGNNFFCDYGLAGTPKNLLEIFQWARAQDGKSTDPTGWDCFLTFAVLEHDTEPSEIDLFSDYFNLYYQSPPVPTHYTGTRWFYFHGEIGGVPSPSTSPIFGRQLFFTQHYTFANITHPEDEFRHHAGVSYSCPTFCPPWPIIGRWVNAPQKQSYAMRYRNIRIPKCSVINQAFIRVTGYLNMVSGPVNCQISAENTSYPNIWWYADLTEFVTRWNTRAGVVNWDNISSWTAEEIYQSPELKATIQAVISRTDWIYGNALGLFWDDWLQRTWWPPARRIESYGYDLDPAKAPILHVYYTWWQAKEIIR